VYLAFRFPVFVREYARGKVEVFGRTRPQRPGAVVEIAVSSGRSYRVAARTRVNRYGYFRKTLRVTNATKRKFRIRAAGLTRYKRAVRR